MLIKIYTRTLNNYEHASTVYARSEAAHLHKGRSQIHVHCCSVLLCTEVHAGAQ